MANQPRYSVTVSDFSNDFLEVKFIFEKGEREYKFSELISQKKKKNINFDDFYKIQLEIQKEELGRYVEHYFFLFFDFWKGYLADKKQKNFLPYFQDNFAK